MVASAVHMVAQYDKRGSSLPLVEVAASNSADEVAIYVDRGNANKRIHCGAESVGPQCVCFLRCETWWRRRLDERDKADSATSYAIALAELAELWRLNIQSGLY